MAEENHCRR